MSVVFGEILATILLLSLAATSPFMGPCMGAAKEEYHRTEGQKLLVAFWGVCFLFMMGMLLLASLTPKDSVKNLYWILGGLWGSLAGLVWMSWDPSRKTLYFAGKILIPTLVFGLVFLYRVPLFAANNGYSSSPNPVASAALTCALRDPANKDLRQIRSIVVQHKIFRLSLRNGESVDFRVQQGPGRVWGFSRSSSRRFPVPFYAVCAQNGSCAVRVGKRFMRHTAFSPSVTQDMVTAMRQALAWDRDRNRLRAQKRAHKSQVRASWRAA